MCVFSVVNLLAKSACNMITELPPLKYGHPCIQEVTPLIRRVVRACPPHRMELHDWTKWFTDVSMCRQVNTRLLSLEKTWHEYTFHGEWKGRSAGGCINHKETFCHNPQVSCWGGGEWGVSVLSLELGALYRGGVYTGVGVPYPSSAC